eukprot:symbB.v1.2.001858.t1/scaffold77.1/size347087/29
MCRLTLTPRNVGIYHDSENARGHAGATMHSQAEEKFPVWYRTYALLILLLVCISNLATRSQPSFLVTIPAPDCADVCTGVLLPYPTCKISKEKSILFTSREQRCQSCRAQPAFWQGAAQQLPPLDELTVLRKASALQTGVEIESPAGFPHAPLGVLPSRTNKTAVHVLHPMQSEESKEVFARLLDNATCLWYWEYGLLIGYGFALVYAAGTIPAGWLCDRHRRTSIIALSTFVWSLSTAMQAQATGSTGLFLLVGCRVMIGLAQSFGTPACLSLLVDYFASNGRQRDMALALLTMVGPQLGVGCASFSIIFAELLGWRWVVLLTGLCGILLAFVVLLTIKEPQRTEWSSPCPVSVVVEEVFEKSRVSRLLMWAVSAKMLSSYSLTAFLPIWFARRNLEGVLNSSPVSNVHQLQSHLNTGYTNDAYAFWNALAVSVAGLLSVGLGSITGRAWSRLDVRAPCYVGLIGSLASLPLIFLMVFTEYFKTSLLCYFLLLVVGDAWFGPSMNLLQLAVRHSVRGQATSMLLGVAALAGNVGPALVGFLDPGGSNIGIHLLWICSAAQVLAALSFLWTANEITLDPVSVGLGLAQDKAP